MTIQTSPLLNATQTAAVLPYPALVAEIGALLGSAAVDVPPRVVQALAGGGVMLVMPATDGRVHMTKLITVTPANAGTGRPTIQGDVVVFDVGTGERLFILDGPVVTARRTAAVSARAAQLLAPNTDGPLLVVGAGVQGLSHVQAFAETLNVREVVVASRSASSAQALAEQARQMGLKASVTNDPNAAMSDCAMIVTCTPASQVVLSAEVQPRHFIAAVGAFKPSMVELSAELCRAVGQRGQVVVDTVDALHEAGDLLQAGMDVAALPTLQDIEQQHASTGRVRKHGPVLFKSCGWAGWDLAAVRVATAQMCSG